MKTHILGIITQGQLGGAQQFIIQLARGLDPEEFELTLAWGTRSGDDIAKHLPPGIHTHRIKHLVRSISPLNDARAVGEITSLIEEVKPQIVLSMSSKAGFVASLACKRYNKRHPEAPVASVYRIGGWAFNDPRPRWERALYRTLERMSAPWKDVIVVNNLSDLTQGQRLGITPRNRLVCIHNGVPLAAPELTRAQAQEELVHIAPQIDITRPIVGTIANFYPTKDIPNLLRAATLVSPDVQFVIVGDGPERGHIRDVAAVLGLEERVVLTGIIPDAQRLIPAFDVLVLPSRKEGFAWVLLEAMRVAVPIIATAVGAAQEVIPSEEYGLLVPPGNWRLLGTAIKRLAHDRTLATSMATRAHDQLVQNFSVERMVKQFEELFRSLV